jgi:hypothetical protein
MLKEQIHGSDAPLLGFESAHPRVQTLREALKRTVG